MKLICIGDSLTFGYGVHLSQRWTRLCAQETGWELVNEGINGDTTGGMLARMQGGVLAELREGGLAISPDVYTVEELSAELVALKKGGGRKC